MLGRIPVVVLLAVLMFVTACTNKKVKNPLADLGSKQPDKVLFDRAMDALKHNRYDVARLTLQTLINTYPDSEYIARAKLGVADSWYVEGGSAALAQAENEYNDFKTFFPNMAEASEAQLKIANIHYQQMEKPDRDFTHAARAEQEYRNLILQFPDSPLVPQAKERLMEVQEILAEREFRIGRFYYLRPSYAAAIARLRSVVDRYPLYSRADEALYLIGQSYEDQIALMKKQNFEEGSAAWKAREHAILDYTNKAAEVYSRVITRYPAMAWAPDANARLEALNRPVPKPTKAMYAQNKKEEESRRDNGTLATLMGNFRKKPDVSKASRVGEPSLTDGKLTSATEVVQEALRTAAGGGGTGGGSVAVETIGADKSTQSVPTPSFQAVAPDGNQAANQPTDTSNELVPNVVDPNELKPNIGPDSALPPPPQVNQIDPNAPPTDNAQATANEGDEPADVTFSSSKHKKKKGIRKVVPF